MPLRLAALAFAAVALVGGETWAQVASVQVDKVYAGSSYIHVLLRYTNSTGKHISYARIDCSVFDEQKHAIGDDSVSPANIDVGQTVVQDMLISIPPNADISNLWASCRVITEKF